MIHSDLLPATLSFGIAAIVTWTEVATSKFPRTLFLAIHIGTIYCYALLYGAISVVLYLCSAVALDDGGHGQAISGPVGGSPWLIAVVIGVCTKAVMHVRLFTLQIGGASNQIPIGIETLVQIFEPAMLRSIDLKHYNTRMTYIAPSVHGRTLDGVRSSIAENLPPEIPRDEQVAFKRDVERRGTVKDMLDAYLLFAGKDNFCRVFSMSERSTSGSFSGSSGGAPVPVAQDSTRIS